MRLRALIAEMRATLGPRWVRPDTSNQGEGGEIRRTISSLRIPAGALHAAVASAKLAPLSDEHWSQVANTESWKATKEDADYYAGKYKRDIQKIYDGYKAGAEMPAPIVLHRPGKRPYCIAGNTRLLAASAMGIRPHVLHVKLK